MALSPAELQALQAAQIAGEVGGAAPSGPPLPTPGAGGSAVQPYSVTNQSLGPSTTSGSSTKVESAEDLANRRAAVEANIASGKAAGEDVAIGPTLTPEEVASDAASKQASAASLKRQAAAEPPSDTTNLPPIMGVPLGLAGKQLPPKGHEYTSQEFNASGEVETAATAGRGGYDPLTGKTDKTAANQAPLTGGITGPKTLSQAKDERAAAEAALQVRLKDEEAAKRAQAEREAAQAAADWKKEHDAALAQAREAAEKAGHSFQQDRSGLQNFLSAIAVGMGAYGAGITHSPNFALDILNKQIDDDFRRKKENLDFATHKLERLGVDRQRIDQYTDREMAKFMAYQQVKVDQAKAVSAQAFARFPVAQQAAKVAATAAEANIANKNAEIMKGVGERTLSSSSTQAATTVQTVEGKDQGGNGPQRETVNELVANKSQVALLGEMQNIIKKNPKAWNAYRKATKETSEFNIAKEGPIGGLLKVGQSVGLSSTPLSLDQRLEKISDPKTRAEAKRINQIFPIIKTGMARVLDPVGVLNESSMQQGMQHLNMNTMSPQEAIDIAEQFKKQADEKAGLLGNSNAMKKAASNAAGVNVRATTPPTEPPKLTPISKEDRAAALKFAKENPRDPRATAALKKIAEADRSAARK